MTKRTIWTFMILAVVAMTMAACGLLQEPAAPSQELQAVPLEIDEFEETRAADEETAPTAEPMEEEIAAPEQVEAAEEEPAPEQDEAATSGSGLIIYTIDPAASEVRFELDEILRGSPVTVVGTTDQIAGEIGVDFNDLSATQVGEITINARGLLTDNNFRNRAIQNEILDTGDYEFITFAPTAVNGLPDSVAAGDSVEFSIDGDLTIREISVPATFTVSAVAVSESQLSGSANTIITRDDFNLTIPEVPSVANVEPEVELYIDFVANAS